MSTQDKMEVGRGLSREKSRSGLSFKQWLVSPPCRLFMCTGFFFFAGVMFGVYMDVYFMADGLFGRPPRAALNSRPGLGIKKDLGIQFRDYIPRFIFIDVSLGPPHSLDLFMETYPEAQKYTIYAFIADKSFVPLYAKFKKIQLLRGIVPSTSNQTETSLATFVQTEADEDINITTVDFSAWLKDTVHMDEYVIVKMTTTPGNEEQVARRLVKTGAIEWIDKYYSTSTDDTTVGIMEEEFSVRNLEVLFWETDQFTYSDFDDLNPIKLTREVDVDVKVSECSVDTDSRKFALVLYISEVNQFSMAALRLLSQSASQHLVRLPVTVLFPLQLLHSPTLCVKLSSLKKEMSLGLYIKSSSLSIPNTDSDHDKIKQNYVRNKLVSAERCFSRGNATVDYTLSSFDIVTSKGGNTDLSWRKDQAKTADTNRKEDMGVRELHAKYRLLKEAMGHRMYTVLSNVFDVTPKFRDSTVPLLSHQVNGALLGFDISQEGTDAALLHLLTSHISDMIPLDECVM